MKTSDRTLIQAMEHDPDRKNDEHDLACRYLTQPGPMDRLVQLFAPSPSPDKDEWAEVEDLGPSHKGRVEVPVCRGTYLVGFADAVIQTRRSYRAVSLHLLRLWKEEVESLERQVKSSRERALRYAEIAEQWPRQRPELEARRVVLECLDRAARQEQGSPAKGRDARIHESAGRWIEESISLTEAQKAVDWLRAKEKMNPFEIHNLHHQLCFDVRYAIANGEQSAKNAEEERTASLEAEAKIKALRDAAPPMVEFRSGIMHVGIEVKIRRETLGACIRQIKLYGMHLACDAWVLATRYRLTASEAETLKSERICHIRLADGFDEYLRQAQAGAPSPEVQL